MEAMDQLKFIPAWTGTVGASLEDAATAIEKRFQIAGANFNFRGRDAKSPRAARLFLSRAHAARFGFDYISLTRDSGQRSVISFGRVLKSTPRGASVMPQDIPAVSGHPYSSYAQQIERDARAMSGSTLGLS